MAIKKVGTANPAEAYLVMPDAIFGSGQDGDATISTNTTLTRDMNYNNLIVNDTYTLNTGGFRIFCRKSLTMGGSSAIIGLPGGSTATGTLGGGGTGSVTNSLGGNGTGGFTATAPTTTAGGSQYYQHPWNAVQAYALHASQTTPLVLRGGAGGTGATAGGGVVVVAARKIFGTGIIRANGANGAGGGVIIIVSNSSVPGSITTDVAGGTGASAGTLLTFTAS
jgi:hypothetical protein